MFSNGFVWIQPPRTISGIVGKLQPKVVPLRQLQVFEDYIQQDLSLIVLVNFEGLNSVVQQKYVTDHLCVLSVSCQLRRSDIVGSASRQSEACAHYCPHKVFINSSRRVQFFGELIFIKVRGIKEEKNIKAQFNSPAAAPLKPHHYHPRACTHTFTAGPPASSARRTIIHTGERKHQLQRALGHPKPSSKYSQSFITDNIEANNVWRNQKS